MLHAADGRAVVGTSVDSGFLLTMLHQWHDSEQQLNLQISDLMIYKRRLRVLACEVGISANVSALQIPPDKPLQPGMIGYVIHGMPIESSMPLFEKRKGYVIYTPAQYERYFVDLNQSFDEYLKSFRSKTRSTILRKVRKFTEFSSGTADFRTYRTPESMTEFFAAERKVSETTYQEKLLDAGLPGDEGYLEELQEAAVGDRVRGYVLYHEGLPVSYLLLEAVHDVLVYKFLGFDPTYGKWSTGTVLHWLALESVFEEARFRMLDFTEGEGEQKRQFGTGSVKCANVYCLKNTLTVFLWLRLHAGTNAASALAGRILGRLGLRSKIRRLIRATA